jgi:MFS transporter, MHS family, proline/betaine transporter
MVTGINTVTSANIGSMRTRAVAAASIGNFLEFFDFVIYGFLAGVIGRLFFPAADPVTSLLSSFATYGVGFLMRPVGSIAIGAYADRYGRKAALILTITMMALATLVTGLIPTYDQIGLLAPIILVICRLLQGFSLGGEWGGAAAFMVEYAPKGRRGWVGSWQQSSTTVGVLVGSLTIALLNYTMSADTLNAWGWRLPFIIGAIVGPVGFYLRASINETPMYEQVVTTSTVERHPISTTLRKDLRNLLVAFGISINAAVPFYIYFVFMPSFATQRLGIASATALFSTSIVSFVAIVLMPITGALSDRVGRKPLILGSTIGALVTSYPLFLLITSHPSFGTLVTAQVIGIVFVSMFSGPLPAILCEMFPTNVRVTSLSIGYTLAVTIFGGFAPFIGTFLVNVTGNPISPTYYVMSAAIVSTIVAAFFYRETAFIADID